MAAYRWDACQFEQFEVLWIWRISQIPGGFRESRIGILNSKRKPKLLSSVRLKVEPGTWIGLNLIKPKRKFESLIKSSVGFSFSNVSDGSAVVHRSPSAIIEHCDHIVIVLWSHNSTIAVRLKAFPVKVVAKTEVLAVLIEIPLHMSIKLILSLKLLKINGV